MSGAALLERPGWLAPEGTSPWGSRTTPPLDMGIPRAFPVVFAHGGYTWAELPVSSVGMTDLLGRVMTKAAPWVGQSWLILLADATGPLYYYSALANGDRSGYSRALAPFAAVEAANLGRLGLGGDPGLVPLSDLHGGIKVYRVADGIPGDYGSWATSHALVGDWTQDRAMWRGSVFRDLAIIESGVKGMAYVACVNTWLRIGFLVRTVGNHADTDWWSAIAHAALGIIELAAGVLTGNAGIVIRGVETEVGAWYDQSTATSVAGRGGRGGYNLLGAGMGGGGIAGSSDWTGGGSAGGAMTADADRAALLDRRRAGLRDLALAGGLGALMTAALV